MKKISILGVIFLVAILTNLHTILASAKWYSFEHNKKVSTEKKNHKVS
jgi:hypothetical protein